MVRKIVGAMVAGLLGVGALAACAGNATGTSEGDSCSSVDECNSQLQCQFVQGHNGSFCCPAPLVLPSGDYTSDKSNCQPNPK